MAKNLRLTGPALLLLLLPVVYAAEQDSLPGCLQKLSADRRFEVLTGKLALGAETQLAPALLADNSLANDKERPIISNWAAARADCVKASSRFGNDVYRPPLQAFSLDAENKVLAAAVELYNRKISFGEFNRRREAIADEVRTKTAQLNRQIQSQSAAFEQADRQAREREQMQREVEEAERQAALAQQQAQQAQEANARLAARSRWQSGPPRQSIAPSVPTRNCFRFGSRITCTGL
jgi:hypothetical protein